MMLGNKKPKLILGMHVKPILAFNGDLSFCQPGAELVTTIPNGGHTNGMTNGHTNGYRDENSNDSILNEVPLPLEPNSKG